MHVSSILDWARKKLKTSASPLLDAEVILSFVLNKPKEFLYTHPEYQLSKKEIKKIQILVNRRAKGEPIAYLTSHKEFYGLDFLVNKHVLIPRPETELMVEEVRKRIWNFEYRILNKEIFLIDVGTGSGCIPIAIAKNLKQKIKIIASDISNQALKVAQHNARHHKVKIRFLKSNLLSAFIQNSKFHPPAGGPNSTLLITANHPYLTATQMKEKTIKHEPRLALFGGAKDLDLYKKFLLQIKILNTKYQILNIFLEIDPSQSRPIIALIKKMLPRTKAEIKKDLAKRNRLIIITLSSPLSRSRRD